MKRIRAHVPPGLVAALALLPVAAFVLLLAACGTSTPETDDSPEIDDSPRVVMVGIDAGSWKLFDPLLEAGEMPHLAALIERGMAAELETVEPVISPAVWTSIATGRPPDVHGVATFFTDRRAIRVPTVWERLAAAGLRVGLYDHLLTWPPRSFADGFVIPGWLRRDARRWPDDVFARAAVEPYVYEVLDVGDDDDVILHLERELASKPATWNRLADAYDLDAGAVVFYALDVTSHRFYHTEFPEEFTAPPPYEPRFAGVLPRVVRQIDAALGQIVAGLGEDDHLLVVSDHGVRASTTFVRHWGFDAGPLLAGAGIDPQRDGVRAVNEFLHLDLVLEPGPAEERDAMLERLVDFLLEVRDPAGAALFDVEAIRDPQRFDTSGRPPWLAYLIASASPAHALVLAVPRDEHLAPLWPDGDASMNGTPTALASFCAPHVFSGDHHEIGVLVAAGPAIRAQDERSRVSVLDVAPLLTYLAGQPIPDDLRPLKSELLEPEHLRRHPPRRIPAAAAPRLEDAEGDAAEGEDEEIRKRLRALGYLD